MAWKLEESARCTMCGTAEWEWEEDKYAYEPQEVWCKGCYLKDTTSETKDNLPGTTVRLVPSAVAEMTREPS